jgi:hypothetical protein
VLEVWGGVQAELKDVIIKFVYEKGDKNDRNNCRTLSRINHIGSKVLELMVMIRVVAASEILGWIPESQSAHSMHSFVFE